ncbi:pilus assembly protein CpaC [Vibrio breoganii]|uniref:type II and III secretion system protein family protein n=1 Tax=Vibrio breoganii TaxID=553239 RepID=UPI000C8636DB|nr:type II and III secretion system protein family protein [Vibrio breoganii]PMG37201.1 pilus assembly protein CpaC [Vibrio breoganii]PML84473.1 pilus assembly protein CpaC [Vibrio breoganii]PMM48766.1 pilus assembly protein CpaC [Vibrio breoganii]PMM84342.1 pilus assembly protein CpaC [Vibrio breoganii]PMO90207.1 pilus assembly protein CpaC [Vibrio breoganii]
MKRIFAFIVSLVIFMPVSIASTTQSGNTITIPQHKSTHVKISGKAKRVSLGDPAVLDIVMLKADELFLIGKKLGSTNLSAWDAQGRLIESLNIEVTHDLNNLKAKLYEFLPEEQIQVHSAQDKLILSGLISSQEKMNIAVKVAQTYSGGDAINASDGNAGQAESGVINLMTIGGAQQVMLEVTVAEVQRSLVRRFDSNFRFFQQSGDFTWGLTSAGAGIGESGGAILPIVDAVGVNDFGFLGGFVDSNTLFTFALDIAKENGVAKILAEPNLTTLSGSQAKFLAGGEFPIPIPSDDGIGIEYKEYGVSVDFTPIVLSDQKIYLELAIDVSEVASSGALSYSPGDVNAAYIVPPLTKRSASSTIELADGQTIGIAGLLNENSRDVANEVPGIGDVPVLGNLFKSKQYVSGETELVILVTPRLAKPIDRDKISLPTDAFVEPTDMEFYLIGKSSYIDNERIKPKQQQDSTERVQASTASGGSEGQFGHSL